MLHGRIALAAAFAVMAVPAFAQELETPRIAAVKVSYVAQTSSFGKAALARMENEAKKKELEISAKAADVQKQQVAIQQSGVGLSDRARADLQRAFDRARVDLDRFREDAQRELQELQAQFDVDFHAKLGPVVDEIAKEKGYHFVFNVDDNELIAWLSPSTDISDEVVKRLDAKRQ
jgi:Skp family chaperone for outer membrane proteins